MLFANAVVYFLSDMKSLSVRMMRAAYDHKESTAMNLHSACRMRSSFLEDMLQLAHHHADSHRASSACSWQNEKHASNMQPGDAE